MYIYTELTTIFIYNILQKKLTECLGQTNAFLKSMG